MTLFAVGVFVGCINFINSNINNIYNKRNRKMYKNTT